ncbi:hypothetical protein FZI91_11255 [Mycobacterium sp. CBMA271]|uniref:MmpS family transport accessory protein n=1 Tax=unclassified Mycobacteroides TaxID=2618759 RepID=UPI0012DE07E8|nr:MULTISPECIES: MmpS family transport accessory protein [unclassified Mycobacteroides]MUM16221.1 hypothetical protein [Mycobacteroides sp. CBMA 326]MUM22276.1 hypothetical protein [Mycobacteroides sp. CBMA 271]
MDSNRRTGATASGGPGSYGSWSPSSQPLDYPDDPAYASQAFEYPALAGASPPQPTTALPQQYGSSGSFGPPPQDPEPPRRSNTFWLWVVGIGALVVIVALIITLVALIQREDDRQPTVVATPSTRTQTTTVPTMPSIPAIPSFTIPPIPINPPTQGSQPATETVVYEVGGTGFAFNITYFDATGSLQTEFNVKLPWRKEFKMSVKQVETAMVIGSDLSHEVTCTLIINGKQKMTTAGKMATCNSVG